jgi:predicted lipoprotein with Yx(FWY)xxD motif
MRPVVVLTCGLVLLVGCSSDSGAGSSPAPTASSVPAPSPPQPSPSASSTSPGNQSASPPPTGTSVKTAASDFGVILFDSTGQAIYLFDKEKSSTSECYGACAEVWPPVLTKRPPKALGAARQSLLGTANRTDGTAQVTYGGHPLYFYAHEGKNEVKCHRIEGFGGLWLVVTATGGPAPA